MATACLRIYPLLRLFQITIRAEDAFSFPFVAGLYAITSTFANSTLLASFLDSLVFVAFAFALISLIRDRLRHEDLEDETDPKS